MKMEIEGKLDKRAEWFYREITLSRHQQKLFYVIKQINEQKTYGLAGGEARDIFIGYEGPNGDAGIDFFAPDFSEQEKYQFEQLTTSLFREDSNILIVADNLGEKYGEISLAGFSYFNTPTVGISKVLVLYSTRKDTFYAIGHKSALKDKQEKRLRIDYPKCKRNISIEEDTTVSLEEDEVISDYYMSEEGCLEIRIAKLSLDDSKLVETRNESVEVSKNFDENLRYGLFNWANLAKIVNLAATYHSLGFQIDESTESILSQMTENLSPKDSKKAAIHIAYKLHPQQFGVLDHFLKTKDWLKEIFCRADEDIFNKAWKTLAKYQYYERVVLQKEDYIFDKV